jgi:hypothetical protein
VTSTRSRACDWTADLRSAVQLGSHAAFLPLPTTSIHGACARHALPRSAGEVAPRLCSATEGAPPDATELTAPTPQPNPPPGPLPPRSPLRLTAAADGSRQPPPPPSAGEGVCHPFGDHSEPGFCPSLQPRQRNCRRATADPGCREGPPGSSGRSATAKALAVSASPGEGVGPGRGDRGDRSRLIACHHRGLGGAGDPPRPPQSRRPPLPAREGETAAGTRCGGITTVPTREGRILSREGQAPYEVVPS